MDEDLVYLQYVIRSGYAALKGVHLALKLLKSQSPAIVQQILAAFREDYYTYEFLCCRYVLLNYAIPSHILCYLAHFCTGNALHLLNAQLYQACYLVSADVPCDVEMTAFRAELNAKTDYKSFTVALKDHKFSAFKTGRLEALAGAALFKTALPTVPDQLCVHVNLLLALELALQRSALWETRLHQQCAGANFSATVQQQVRVAIIKQDDLKKHMETAYSLLILCQGSDLFIENGPLLVFKPQLQDLANHATVSELRSLLPQPREFIKMIVNAYQELSARFAKTQVIELLSIFLLRYCQALAVSFAPPDVLRTALNDVFGFLLNLKDYSSVGAAVQFAAIQLGLLCDFAAGDFLGVVFSLRKLSYTQLLKKSYLDVLAIDNCNLTFLTALLLLYRGTAQQNARHIARLYDVTAGRKKLYMYAAEVAMSTDPRVQLYYRLILCEAACFRTGTLYGELFCIIDPYMLDFICRLCGYKAPRDAAIFLLKGVQKATQAVSAKSVLLAYRFKLLEYMLAGQIEKALCCTAIGPHVRSFVEMRLRQSTSWIFAVLHQQTHLATNFPAHRALLPQMEPEEASFAISRITGCDSQITARLCISDCEMRGGLMLFQINACIFRLPLTVGRLQIRFAAASPGMPENVALEMRALEALSAGNIIGFVFWRFYALYCALQQALEGDKEAEEDAKMLYKDSRAAEDRAVVLEQLERHFASFYNSLPALLFGPLAGAFTALTAFCGTARQPSADALYDAISSASEAVFARCGLPCSLDRPVRDMISQQLNYSEAIEAHRRIVRHAAIRLIKPTFVTFEFMQHEAPLPPTKRPLQPLQKDQLLRVAMDPLLQQIPLEKISSFPLAIRYLNSSRKYSLAEQTEQSVYEEAPMPYQAGYMEPHQKCQPDLFYVDPSLLQTAERLRTALTTTRMAWYEISDPKELLNNICSADRFLFAGHGGGENLLPRHRLTVLDRLPEAALLGYASLCGARGFGGFLRYDPHDSWRKSGFLVGCLWDMLGSDLDRFAVAWARETGLSGFIAGLASMRWKYCMSMGVVAWG